MKNYLFLFAICASNIFAMQEDKPAESSKNMRSVRTHCENVISIDWESEESDLQNYSLFNVEKKGSNT